MKVYLGGQTALVTGAGRGIGRAIGNALALNGARVYLAARSASQLESAADEIRSDGGKADPVPTDLARERDILSLFAKIRREVDGLDMLFLLSLSDRAAVDQIYIRRWGSNPF